MTSTTRPLPAILAIALACALHPAAAFAQSAVAPAATVLLQKTVLASGGVDASTAGVHLKGTIGQPLINIASQPTLVMTQGFWFVGWKKTSAVENEGIAEGYRLGSWPNPFTVSTTVQYTVVSATRIALNVYDIHGRIVRHLSDAERGPNTYTASWDGADDEGRPLPAGCYIIRLADASGSSILRDKPVLLVR
jgi:hypothetical protein